LRGLGNVMSDRHVKTKQSFSTNECDHLHFPTILPMEKHWNTQTRLHKSPSMLIHSSHVFNKNDSPHIGRVLHNGHVFSDEDLQIHTCEEFNAHQYEEEEGASKCWQKIKRQIGVALVKRCPTNMSRGKTVLVDKPMRSSTSLDNFVNDRIKEDATDTNTAPNEFESS